MSDTHDRSMRMHEESAQRHEAAAALWDTRREAKRAEFERGCARIEREAARLDADRSTLQRLRGSSRAHPHAAGFAEINRLRADIERRSIQLQAEDVALEQERARLWPPEDSREHSRDVCPETAPIHRDSATSERTVSDSEAADGAIDAAGRVTAQTLENARHLSSILAQTARLIETSAALAEANAERLERVGRADAGAQERQVADRAREAAHRARAHAEAWSDFARSRSTALGVPQSPPPERP
jgi:hypothetical protein